MKMIARDVNVKKSESETRREIGLAPAMRMTIKSRSDHLSGALVQSGQRNLNDRTVMLKARRVVKKASAVRSASPEMRSLF
jgi:hypothetical protein